MAVARKWLRKEDNRGDNELPPVYLSDAACLRSKSLPHALQLYWAREWIRKGYLDAMARRPFSQEWERAAEWDQKWYELGRLIFVAWKQAAKDLRGVSPEGRAAWVRQFLGEVQGGPALWPKADYEPEPGSRVKVQAPLAVARKTMDRILWWGPTQQCAYPYRGD